MTLQDILHGLLIVALVGTGIEPKLGSILSTHSLAVIDVVLGGLTLLVYYSDVIFVKKEIPPINP